MAHVRAHGQVRRNGSDDVVDAFIALVIGMKHAAGILAAGELDVEVGEIPVVDERPMIVAVPDNTDQAIGGGFEQLAHDPLPRP